MENTTSQELLKDRRVVEEINRHLWIESEKAGRDIGFERAAEDWLAKFSKAWMQYHMPNKKANTSKNTEKVSTIKPARPSKSRA